MDPLAGSQWSTPGVVAGFAKSAPAIALARLGWAVVGTDLSWPMLRAAATGARDGHFDGRLHLVLAGEPVVFTQFAGEPLCFLTAAQLVAELGRVGFAPDAAVPLREYNRPQPGALRSAMAAPVIYEAAFRHVC
jgi:hypothetical protein